MRGGLRTRLVADSTRITVIAGLQALGWFEPTIHDRPPGLRRHHPLKYVTTPVSWQTAVTPNAIALSIDDVVDQPLGLGDEIEDRITFYVDVFAESDAVGWELALNVRDILIGKLPEIGRTGPVIDLYDLRMATPVAFSQADVTDVSIDQAQSDARAWQAHWFMIRGFLEDDYDDEYGIEHPAPDWSADYQPAWDWIQQIETTA
jgi:hypothetical protein